MGLCLRDASVYSTGGSNISFPNEEYLFLRQLVSFKHRMSTSAKGISFLL